MDNMNLPEVRGEYRVNFPLHRSVWFNVGGPADILFKPADAEDLAHFLKHLAPEIPVTVIGVGSNLLVRDGGVRGVVIRLGQGFTGIEFGNNEVRAGAGVLDQNLARACAKEGAGGLEFLSGIPGTIGGAVFMNAGAYGREVRDVLIDATIVTRQGEIKTLTASALDFQYRKSKLPEGSIVVAARFQTMRRDKEMILQDIETIRRERETSQPVKARTGGSTFKNPEGAKAWQLIDRAGCRGLRMGGAVVSEKHCNFLINEGSASASDLETLGETVRRRVKETSGVDLHWEIQRIGEAGDQGDGPR